MNPLFAPLLDKRPKRASYSAISTHESCGASYGYSYLMGVRDQAGPAAARGTRLHYSGELFLKGELPAEKLPVDYWRVKGAMIKYKELGAKSEEVWCINKDWKFVPKDHPTTFLKSVVDVHWMEPGVLHVRDLKTGQIYPEDHADQLQLYGTKGLVKYPKAKEVRVGGLYIDQGRVDTEAVYPRKMLPMLIARWTERTIKVLTDEEFAFNPSPENCKWCSYSAKKGGPCTYGV